MSRRLKQTFRCGPLEELARQLLFSPPDKRIRQVFRVEKLHDQTDPAKNYPLDFLFYRISGYRREGKDSLLLTGEAVLPDLRLMIDALSRSLRIPMDDGGPVETVQELAHRLDVSSKTIGRWRGAGLRWRWAVPPGGGRKVVVVPCAASQRFIAEHAGQVSRAASFTQIEPAARRRLIDRARQIASRRDSTLNQVAAHLAHKTGRALQTVRQILEHHDRDHPGSAIFAGRAGPLTGRDKRVIARAYRMGTPIDKIAAHFSRTRSTVYRAINQHHAGKAGRVPLDYVASPIFGRDDADEVILGRPVEAFPQSDSVTTVALDDLPEPVRPLFRQPVIPPKQIRSLFIRYNYLKHCAAQTREGFDTYSPGAKQVRRFNDLVDRAGQLRDLLVRVHLPVVLSVSRRHLIGRPSATTGRLVDLLELGLGVLIQAVETFNASRNPRFDSVLTNRLLGRFATDAPHDDGPGSTQAQRRLQSGDAFKRLTGLAREAGVEITDV